MSTSKNTTVTTTNLAVGDNENSRIPAVSAVPTPATVEAEGQRIAKGGPWEDNINRTV